MANRFHRLLKVAPPRLGRHPLAPALLAALVFAAIGLVLPPLSTDGRDAPGLAGNRALAELGAPEDLAAFRSMSRWGTDIQSVEDAQNETDDDGSSGLNIELVKLGFIGLTLAAAENTVVLTRPDGRAIHLTDGDTLPDGRTLVSVTENALTLEDPNGERETLVLFPRLSASDDR